MKKTKKNIQIISDSVIEAETIEILSEEKEKTKEYQISFNQTSENKVEDSKSKKASPSESISFAKIKKEIFDLRRAPYLDDDNISAVNKFLYYKRDLEKIAKLEKLLEDSFAVKEEYVYYIREKFSSYLLTENLLDSINLISPKYKDLDYVFIGGNICFKNYIEAEKFLKITHLKTCEIVTQKNGKFIKAERYSTIF